MKKILVALLFLCWASATFAGQGVVPGLWVPVVAGGATNYTNDANIISWWMMEEASGTREDGSANNNDLTDVETVAQSATHIQGSYSSQFLASSYEVLYRTDANLAPSTFPGKSTTGNQGAFSVGCWVRVTTTGGSDTTILSKGNIDAADASFGLMYTGTVVRFWLSSNGWGEIAEVVTGTTTLVQNTWYHIVGVYTGSAVQLWLGTEAGSSAQDNTAVAWSGSVYRGAGPFTVGAKNAIGQAGFPAGQIDEVFIFSDALSGTEIEEIRAHGLAGER